MRVNILTISLYDSVKLFVMRRICISERRDTSLMIYDKIAIWICDTCGSTCFRQKVTTGYFSLPAYKKGGTISLDNATILVKVF